MSHKRHEVSDNRSIECLLNNLFWLTPKTQKSTLVALCEGNQPVTGGFPSNVEIVDSPCQCECFTLKSMPILIATPWQVIQQKTQRPSDRVSRWRHQMEAFSALLAICAGNSPVPAEFPTKRPVTWSFGVFFDLRLNKGLSKQSGGWWFETPSRPLWRHSNVYGRRSRPQSSYFLRSPDFCPKAVCRICVDHIQLWVVALCKSPSNHANR